MKKTAPVVLTGFLLTAGAALLCDPGLARAQGYPGLMSAQQGYQTPRAPVEAPAEAEAPAAAENAPAGSSANVSSGGLPSSALPYGGTGADDHVGHMTVSGPGAEAADAAAETEPGNAAENDDAAGDQGSGKDAQTGYADSFAPREKPWVDPNQPKTLYDFVQAATPASRAGAPARQAQAQADAALQAQRDEIDRANAERTRQQNEAISASADEIQAANQKKQEEAEAGIDSSQDAAP